jgi:hypothetical protein
MFGSYGFGANTFSGTEINSSAILVCISNAAQGISCDYTDPSQIIFQENGGTSAASPFSAGVMALILQKTGQVQGLANPMFYKLAAAQNTTACNASTVAAGNACVFYDVTQGSNSQACIPGGPNCVTNVAGDEVGLLSGYTAGTGYDQTSGLGTMNVTNMVNAWAAAAGAPAVTLTPTSLTFASTTIGATSAAKTITVKNTGTAALSITNLQITGTNFTSYNGTTTCASPLAAGASCTISITFTPTAAGTLVANMVLSDNAGTGSQTATLSGTGASAATTTVSVSPTSLTFASTTVGSATAAQTVTIKNTGTAAVTLTSETLTGTNATSFVKSATTCTTSLAASASCTVSIEFKPTAAGSLTASLSVADNATGSPQTVALSGTGTAAALTVSVSPTTLTFASTAAGATTAAQVITVKNTGTSAVTLTSETIAGTNATSFLISANTCGTSLAAAATCTVSVEFKPASAGTKVATLSVADNATGSPQTVALSGTGTAAGLTVTLSPATLTFASTTVGATTAAQTVTIKNTSTTAVTLTSETITGTNATSFLKSATTCTTSLAAAASCTVSVEFKPAAAGALTASLSVADNATGSPQTVALSGTGASSSTATVTLTPTTIAFPATVTGTTSDAQVVTLTNTGTASVTITGITLGGTNSTSFVDITNCGTTLASGASCSLYVAFKPSTAAAKTGTLSVADNATGSPQKVTLSGTGTAAPSVTLSPTSIAFPTTTHATTSPAQAVTIKNAGTATLTLASIALTGTNPTDFVALDTCGATLAGGATCTVYVAFSPAAAGSFSAKLTVTDNGSTASQSVTLTGTGK